MRRGTAVAAALSCALALTACADDPAPGGPGGDPTATPPVSVAPTPHETAPSPTAAPTGAATAAVPFPADTQPDTGAASGGILGMRVARAAVQPGFERVVFELKGSGAPGWHVSYVDAPTSDGSGDPVQVKGSAFLQVVVTGVGYPQDTGVPEPANRRFTPATSLVKEVVLNGVFEGQYTAFVGLGSEQPFRVFRLSSPPRVVVDVRTG